jgi:hypothetical protein
VSKRQYPRQAWVLLPSFKPKEVTIVKRYGSWSGTDDWDVAEGGKLYRKDSLFPTMTDAIAFGRIEVEKQQADIAKRQERLIKRIAALDKAAAQGDQAAEKGGDA